MNLTEMLTLPNNMGGTQAWRRGAFYCSLWAVAVFIVNIGITIWAVTNNAKIGSGRQVLYDGSCDKVRQLNVVVHLVINLLSTVLLSASDYCMQCCSAPTREEIDKCHLQQAWLDVGVQSVRNLAKIDRKRAILWGLLGISSLPLHLL